MFIYICIYTAKETAKFNLPCNHLTCVAGPYPLSFLAAILNMIAGLLVVSMCAAPSCVLRTVHWLLAPQ